MGTALGGPGQVIVKCRNNDEYGGVNIEKGDAVSLVTTTFDTNTGEAVLFVTAMKGGATNPNTANFLGIALGNARKGPVGTITDAGSGTLSTAVSGTGALDLREYVDVCVFGLCEAKVASAGGLDVLVGEHLVICDTNYPAGVNWTENSGKGILGGSTAVSADTPLAVGWALETGGWGSSGANAAAVGATNVHQLTWVFINGIGRHAFGAT